MAWLFGIAGNVVADDLRQRARERRAFGRVGARRPVEDDAIAAAQERIDAAAQARQMYTALERLPPDQRAVVELVALDGLSVVDVARTLGVQRSGRNRAKIRVRSKETRAPTQEARTTWSGPSRRDGW